MALKQFINYCFACDDFGKGELWNRCMGCEFGCARSASGGTPLMVYGVALASRCTSFYIFIYKIQYWIIFFPENLFCVAIQFFMVVS
jgi:hypothetical protein